MTPSEHRGDSDDIRDALRALLKRIEQIEKRLDRLDELLCSYVEGWPWKGSRHD